MGNMSRPKSVRTYQAARNATGEPKALVKGLALIDLVADEGPQPIAGLVAASGLPRATVLRLLEALVAHGVMLADGSGAYHLGPRLASWGQGFLRGLDVRREAEDLMAALTARTRETCFLGIREGDRVLYVAKADSPQAVRPAAVVGSTNPLYCTAMGKILLAYADEETVARCLRGPLTARTANTITEPARIAAELARTRERGHSIDDIENEDGVRCVAAPVRDQSGEVVAAMSVAAPAYRLALEDVPGVAAQVCEAAATLSGRMGHRGQVNEPEGRER
jgi:DNA-binding IclR family transcriptional regulator